MFFNKATLTIFLLSIFLAFAAGFLVRHLALFPYPQLQALKQYFSPSVSGKKTLYSNYYYRQVSLHKLLHGQYDVIFLGDSLTDEVDWQQFFPGFKIANLGIMGDTTNGVIDRMDIVNTIHAKNIFLMIGVNDFLREQPLDGVIERYRTIVQRLIEHDFTVYIQSTLLVSDRFIKYNNNIQQLNLYLQRLADTSAKVEFIDLNQALSISSQLNPAYTTDGVHLNGDGYQQWFDVIRSYLTK
jgi:lysophospholipase L1-like esterase